MNDCVPLLSAANAALCLTGRDAPGLRRRRRGWVIPGALRRVYLWERFQSRCIEGSLSCASSSRGIPAKVSPAFPLSSRPEGGFRGSDFSRDAWISYAPSSPGIPAKVLPASHLSSRPGEGFRGSDFSRDAWIFYPPSSPGIHAALSPAFPLLSRPEGGFRGATEVTPARSSSDKLPAYRDRKSHTMNRHLNNPKPTATSRTSIEANQLIP